ncbi:MAG: hypothetical protein H6Q72_4279 [Firmicutes bacterium]|nr:hypothetical protein [Bacillota bacterium]
MGNVSLFIPLTKVDEEKRLVYGIASREELDNAREIFDYEKSKPYIEAWSQDFKEKTDGKSKGNLRAMHKAISAGKLVDLTFHDEEKAVSVCAKVIDDEEWNKCLEGVYTGFSFGGVSVGAKVPDPDLGGMRYTLKPNELSLADKPCVPSAVFYEVVKTDGTTEQRPFKSVEGGGELNVETKTDPAGDIQKAGARNSKSDKEKLQAMHDHARDLGAECKCAKCGNVAKIDEGGSQDVNKLEGQALDQVNEVIAKTVAPFQEAINKLTETLEEVQKTNGAITELKERIEKLEADPLPSKTVANQAAVAITKAQDANPAQEEDVISKADTILDEMQKENSELGAY